VGRRFHSSGRFLSVLLAAVALGGAFPLGLPAVKGVMPAPPPCVGGSLPVMAFKLDVLPLKHGSPLPLQSVNLIRAGDKLKYVPLQLPPAIRKKAKIALVVVSTGKGDNGGVQVLPARPVKAPSEWTIPVQASVVGVILGPQGLNLKKFNRLVGQDPELIPQLAAYARQTATVNALIATLSQYDESKPGAEDLSAILQGFSSRYGVMMPQLSAQAPASQQAQQLLRAVMPSISTYSPAAAGPAPAVEQSAGLAASLAMLFYGTPVGLAAGGAAMLENLHTLVSPQTDFRAAFVQPSKAGNVNLCSENQPPKPRTRIAYLWMLRIPDARAPSASLAQDANIPLGIRSNLKVACATHEQLRLLPRSRQWGLKSPEHLQPIPVRVTVGNDDDVLSLDLSHTSLPPGDYHLVARWDWQPMRIKGTVHVHPFGDFSNARVTAGSEDRLVAGNGVVPIKLVGADFEFVKSVAIQTRGAGHAPSRTLSFTLPGKSDAGPQSSLQTDVDTSLLRPGPYQLLLTQTNGKMQSVPVTLHLPNPTLNNLPLQVNLGQAEQAIVLHGTDLERIQKITSPDAVWTLSPTPAGNQPLTERRAVVKLLPGARQGKVLGGSMSVEGIGRPIKVPDLFKVAGPLPEIVRADASFSNQGSVEIEKGEIPAGSKVSFAIYLKHVDGRPSLELACANAGDTKQSLRLKPGDRDSAAQLDYAGENVLFLSLDPGVVGQSGCELQTTVTTLGAGASKAYDLGRIIRVPQIDKFTLTDRKLGNALYAGYLTGSNLQMISQAGWNSTTGFPVQGIPTPVTGSAQEQTLKIALPWPPPSPQAHVYVWLFGEKQGRRTSARY
jgi:hypothetical protein